jgi:TolB protein
MLTLAGNLGPVQGNYPVWTSNNMIAYNGCGRGAEKSTCGISLISAGATLGASGGATPVPLTTDASDIPSDTQDNLLTFTSQRDGNWEAYLINLDGTGLRNISNNPDANDGLPTLSPDGKWVAFVSDRQGSWAVWAVPIEGSFAQKLFDLPTDTPWGSGDRAWINERISWGK